MFHDFCHRGNIRCSGQISDFDVSCQNLCRQIDEGLAEEFTEADIRPVHRTFKDMLTTKNGLTVDELK